ncbi:tyrosine-type recombinase/integrase [Mycolicibacterium chubuense]|uniref:tyrosine-type recombinase/integrase n=1 Tax=Mycolicibacterium chubuense TaxID=1800 RepID=UPI001EF10681|nr:tyrosine-type recombinase/integrase [Mycolicibacterium chubuense]
MAELQWSDVDFVSRRLHVRRAYSEEAPRGEMAPVKDHQAWTVPIPAMVSAMLADFGADRRPGELVFPSASGTPLRNRNFWRDVFDDAVKSARLDITPHDLRDTAASPAIQAAPRWLPLHGCLATNPPLRPSTTTPGYFRLISTTLRTGSKLRLVACSRSTARRTMCI